MNKAFLGLTLGGILGLLDGLSSWLAPAARPMMVEIIIGSTIKGLISGVLIGLFARRTGPVHGLGVWFDAELCDGLRLSNRPPSRVPSWQHAFLPLREPLLVEAGQQVEVALEMSDGGRRWAWRIGEDGAEQSTERGRIGTRKHQGSGA